MILFAFFIPLSPREAVSQASGQTRIDTSNRVRNKKADVQPERVPTSLKQDLDEHKGYLKGDERVPTSLLKGDTRSIGPMNGDNLEIDSRRTKKARAHMISDTAPNGSPSLSKGDTRLAQILNDLHGVQTIRSDELRKALEGKNDKSARAAEWSKGDSKAPTIVATEPPESEIGGVTRQSTASAVAKGDVRNSGSSRLEKGDVRRVPAGTLRPSAAATKGDNGLPMVLGDGIKPLRQTPTEKGDTRPATVLTKGDRRPNN